MIKCHLAVYPCGYVAVCVCVRIKVLMDCLP